MIPGYEIVDEVTSTEWFTLQKGRSVKDGQPFLLKSPRRHPSKTLDAELLLSEFDLLRSLDNSGILRAKELVRKVDSCCLVLKGHGGRALGEYLASSPINLESFFKFAISLCSVLVDLHRQDLVCRNLCPRTILFAPDTEEATLADLSLAWRETRQHPLPLPFHSMGSLLPYISPEQTGRMNRTFDHRSDLYSLGAIFYEMLCGAPPFESKDILELIHGHIARIPSPPAGVGRDIPAPLSQMVMRLLAKTAEERYQSALGLKLDLEHCASQWSGQTTIAPFPLGKRDVSDRFLIPQKLYGREAEVDALLSAFDLTCQGPTAMLLVAGYSGIGKSSLVQELYKPIVRQRGYFISGKCDQVVRNIPFVAVIQAFRGFVQQILSENEERLRLWRTRLSEALGSNGGVLTEVIPEIELVIGKQPTPPVLGPTEALNRFQMVFQNFVGALAQPEHPLVVFLDDLQWADSATLGLLQPLLTSPDLRYLFLMGAYRDNEVDPSHPLAQTLKSLESAGSRIHRVSLGPLHLSDLTLFIQDTLHCGQSESEPLARLVLEKTGGNPFFVIQFLKALKEDGLLEFAYPQGCWTYRMDDIRRAGITDNVIDLMTRKIERLSADSQHLLTLAACIGNPFDLSTLALVSQQSERAVADGVSASVNEGLVLPSISSLNDYSSQVSHPDVPTASSFVFLHDRVQQAAYALVPDKDKPRVHLTVGRLLLERSDSAEERTFDIVYHLNLGRNLITDTGERLKVMGLNLKAGRKAKASTAYQAALGYFKAGIALAAENQWDTDYDLMFALHLERAESEYLCGHFEEADHYCDFLLERARTRLEKAQVYSLRVVQSENLTRYTAAVEWGRAGLALFGVLFPESPREKEALLEDELSQIHVLMNRRPIESLADLPVMEDLEKRMVMELLTLIWASTYIAGDLVLTRLLSASMVRFSLVYGNTEQSAYGYVTHAITVGPVRGDYQSAYEWGELALRVNERFNDPRLRAKVHQQFHAHSNLWRRPFQSCIPHAREAWRSGLEAGDFTYAGYGAFTETWNTMLIHRDLNVFVRECSSTLTMLEKVKMAGLVAGQMVIRNWARALQGLTYALLSLSDESFNEEAYTEAYKNNPFFLTFLYVLKLHLSIIFCEYAQAQKAAEQARAVVHNFVGTIWPVWLDFLNGLTLLAVHPNASEAGQQSSLTEITRIQKSLWLLADSCPENFRCWSLLLDAGLEVIHARTSDAICSYEQAIQTARETGNLQNEALACDLFGRFWNLRGNSDIASLYLGKARRYYSEWGAVAKVRRLDGECSGLAGEDARFEAPPVEPGTSTAGSVSRHLNEDGVDSLDIATVTKAARAIAVEIELEELLRRLMKIAIENAGAQKGFFLEEKDGQLQITAEANVDGEQVNARLETPLHSCSDLSKAVVHYVHKTGESVVIGDACADDRFSGDSYIASMRPKSILCVPVVHQGKLAGILYLENNLTAGAFTAGKMEVMRILSSQAAISLENARLYLGMTQEVDRRRRAEEELRIALAEVESLKNRLQAENIYLQEEIRREHNFEEIVGSSPVLLELLRQVEQVAPTDSTTLIFGETGTGKELIARAIHNRSNRRERPLVKVNCGAISAGLVESELFGHVKGAFTGAIENRSGRFELADGGTLFLDEVSELPLETQVKLLRVLQEQEFEPVGGSRTLSVDVRIIAASNRDLVEAVSTGRFRSDLFYRLNVFPLTLPPLRARKSDIPQLVMFFLARFSKKSGKPVKTVSQETMELLVNYSWPGNIRELQNVIERAVVLSHGSVLVLGHDLLPGMLSSQPATMAATAVGAPPASQPLISPPSSSSGIASPVSSLVEVDRTHILTILNQTNWVIEGPHGAARLLNLHPNTLRSRMKKLGIRRSSHEIS